jgi:DNA-binding NtrC family response regulator
MINQLCCDIVSILVITNNGYKYVRTENLVFTHDSDDDNSRKYILIVDSELDLLNLMQRMLLVHGFKLCVFNDGLAALKHFSLNSKVHPIVICDIRIRVPDMTGGEFVKQVRKINPKVKLILTGDEEQPPSDANADAFIKKPFSLETLRSIVQEHYHQEMVS